MVEIKRCQVCGKEISSIHDIGFNKYRHIRIKYCKGCRDYMEALHNRNRQSDYKQRQKTVTDLQGEKIGLLQEENELIRQRNLQLKEEIEFLKHYRSSYR